MIPNYFVPLANHVWQSSLFAAGVWILALTLRKNRAAVRHRLWFAASVKFLVPFSLLVGVGSQLQWLKSPDAPPPVSIVVTEISQPFALSDAPVAATVVSTRAFRLEWVSTILAGLWICGFAASLCWWFIRWRELRRAVDRATPLNLDFPMRAMSCRERIEPGVFGVFRPVLLVPQGITDRLSPGQLRAVLAHELCHIRRRDNITAAIHLFVEALFWFCPLVWWIRSRLIEEQERACDEEVLRLGSDPQIYAESILKICEFCVTSPLMCAPGIMGSDLRKRIREIMKNQVAPKLSFSGKVLLTVAAAAAVGGPIGIGFGYATPTRGHADVAVPHATGGAREGRLTIAQVARTPAPPAGQPTLPSPTGGPISFDVSTKAQARHVDVTTIQVAQTQAAPTPAPPPEPRAVVPRQFEAASIKAGNPDSPLLRTRTTPGGNLRAGNTTLRTLIEDAYRIKPFQLTSGPQWIDEDKFQLLAKSEESATPDQVLLMLRALLADRFQLVLRRETREQAISYLTMQNQTRLIPSRREAEFGFTTAVPPERIRSASWVNHVAFRGTSMAKLADMLSRQLGHIVEDRTGLSGDFDFQLDATHGENEPNIFIAPWAPSLGQIGLKLESGTGPVEFFLIESAQKPSEN